MKRLGRVQVIPIVNTVLNTKILLDIVTLMILIRLNEDKT